jgi:hypothetical protein
MIVFRRTLVPALIVASLVVLAACSGSGNGVLNTAGKGAVVNSAAAGTSLSAKPLATGASGVSAASVTHHGCSQPEQTLQAANVTFSSILARNLAGQLIDVTIDLPVTVDMLSLLNGQEITLPIGFLPPDTYDQIVVVMTQVAVTLADGTQVAITPPGGGWTAIVPVTAPFTVVLDQTTAISINFRVDLSFGCNANAWEFHPEFECNRGHHGD